MTEIDATSLPSVNLHVADTLWEINVTKHFLDLTEAQMSNVMRQELESLQAALHAASVLVIIPEPYSKKLQRHEMFYGEGIIPALRYSHVVLLHILIETRLRAFCRIIKAERKLPDLVLNDFRGGPMDQIQIYLTKLVGISISEIPQWESLRNLQKIRDCIVHVYGVVGESRDEKLPSLISKTPGLGIDDQGKLEIKIEYCAAQIEIIRECFDGLFRKVEWKV